MGFREEPVTKGVLEVVGQHCSGITSGPVYADQSEISIVAMCHIHDTDSIMLFSRFGSDVRRWEVAKFFKREHQSIHVYRIDWSLQRLEFFMNGYRVGLIVLDDHVPKRPMKIFVQMLHDGLDKWFPPEWAAFDKGISGAQTIVHRVRYIKMQSPEQMMIVESDASKVLLWTLVIVVVIGLLLKIGVGISSNSHGKKIELQGGYYKLLGPYDCTAQDVKSEQVSYIFSKG